jgi:hypothetical protein
MFQVIAGFWAELVSTMACVLKATQMVLQGTSWEEAWAIATNEEVDFLCSNMAQEVREVWIPKTKEIWSKEVITREDIADLQKNITYIREKLSEIHHPEFEASMRELLQLSCSILERAQK